jgi:menaquinone-dependent protoporphyrinogen oxidase
MPAARVDVKVLIAYGSHLGATAGIAEEIADTLRRETGATVTVEPAILGGPIDAYDAVVVGGGTYGGRWHPDSVAFVRRHAVALANRRVWFFSDGPLGPTATVRPKAAHRDPGADRARQSARARDLRRRARPLGDR